MNSTPNALNLLTHYADSICGSHLARQVELCLTALGGLPSKVRRSALVALPNICVWGVRVMADGEVIVDGEPIDLATAPWFVASAIAIIMLGLAWMIARTLRLTSPARRIRKLIEARHAGVLSAAR